MDIFVKNIASDDSAIDLERESGLSFAWGSYGCRNRKHDSKGETE